MNESAARRWVIRRLTEWLSDDITYSELTDADASLVSKAAAEIIIELRDKEPQQ